MAIVQQCGPVEALAPLAIQSLLSRITILTYNLRCLGSVALVRELLDWMTRETLSSAQQQVVLAHLANPSTSARRIADLTGTSLNQVRFVYQRINQAPTMARLSSSPFYSRRLMYQFARETASEWLADPARPKRILAGETPQVG